MQRRVEDMLTSLNDIGTSRRASLLVCVAQEESQTEESPWSPILEIVGSCRGMTYSTHATVVGSMFLAVQGVSCSRTIVSNAVEVRVSLRDEDRPPIIAIGCCSRLEKWVRTIWKLLAPRTSFGTVSARR